MGCVAWDLKRSSVFVNAAGGDGRRAKVFLQRRKEFHLLVAVFSLCVSLAAPWSLKAQVAGGSITGTVRGESGAPMPGVHISIADVGAVATRSVTTDNDGFYNVPALPPGGYEMTASAPGFVTQLVTTINVAAGAERVLNVAMRPGDPQQTEIGRASCRERV